MKKVMSVLFLLSLLIVFYSSSVFSSSTVQYSRFGDVEQQLNFEILSNTENPPSSLFPRQWGLKNTGQILLRNSGELQRERLVGLIDADIDWVRDFELDHSNEQVIVAVIDSGLDLNHPKLEGRIWSDPDCHNNDEGQDDFCPGYNFIDRNFNLTDETGHGTHVAGVIAANWSSFGVMGVTKEQVKIMPLKVLNEDLDSFVYEGRLITDIMAEALMYARQKGADVVNMSLGWPQAVQTPRFKREVEKTLEAGIPIIVAAGNNRKNIPTYPCSMEGVICVGAINNKAEMAVFSNYGGKVDLLAPGESILSLFPQNLESRNLRINGHEVRRGTSQAAPFVSAIAASLKLRKNDISLGELKAKLYKSAREFPEHIYQSRYGLVSMKEALELEPEHFVEPIFKDVLEVIVDENGQFALPLAFKNWLSEINNVEIEVSIEGEDISLTPGSSRAQLSFDHKERKEIVLKGEVRDFSMDSHRDLKLKITNEDKVLFEGKTMLVFSLDLTSRESLKTTTFSDQQLAKQILRIQGDQSMSRLTKVDDPHSLVQGASYYYPLVDPRTRKTSLKIYTINSLAEVQESSIQLPQVNRVLSVLKTKFRSFGEIYFVYSMKNSQTLLLSFYDDKGNPLYGEKSHWEMPITAFGGLPVSSGRHNFQWIEIDTTTFGPVPVPIFSREGYLPESDNSLNPLRRLSRQRRLHIYYLKPKIEGGEESSISVDIRAFDSFSIREKLSDELGLIFGEQIELMPLIPQSLGQLKNFEVMAPLAAGRYFDRDVYGLEIEGLDSLSLTRWDQGEFFLESNSIRPTRDLDQWEEDFVNDSSRGQKFSFVTLFNRQKLRVALMDSKVGVTNSTRLKTQSWADQVFNPLISFTSNMNQRSYHFIESRYHIYSIMSDATKTDVQKLPVNRDSAFPGVQFAETFEPIRLKATDDDASGKMKPGVFVNSRLIFGNLLYVMTHGEGGSEGDFIRPISLSWQIPQGCVPLGHFESNRESFSTNLSLICRDLSTGQTYWATQAF